MAFADLFRRQLAEAAPSVSLAEYGAVANENEMLRESLAGVEQLAREDVGWRRLGMEQEQQFTRAGLLAMQGTCLTAAISSPLIGRGLRIRRNYVWGRGLEISAREASTEGDDSGLSDIVAAFIDSPEYERTLGSAQAREERETDLGIKGEFFILAVHDQFEKTVRPRLILPAQVVDYIADPDDITAIWFYKRQWTTNRVNMVTGAKESVQRTEWHPVLDYRPPAGLRIPLIGGFPVRWDQPIQHCAVNTLTDGPYGIPDAWSALSWARAYGDFLTQWAVLMRALSRYAWRSTAPGARAAKVVKPAIANASADGVGGTAVMSTDATLEAIPKSGATIDAGSGKPLAGMAAAALDVPITMLLADPGITGARATAETLDKPLELTTGSRQGLWIDWQKALLAHVLLRAVEDRELAGQIVQQGTRQRAVFPDGVDGTIDVTFPPIEDTPLAERLDAIAKADSLGTLPPLLIARMALEALGVEDIDEVLDDLTDDDGNFIDPRVTAGLDALRRERNGAPGSQAEEAYR